MRKPATPQHMQFITRAEYDDLSMETGFVENFDAGVGQVIDEELSVSAYINRGPVVERNTRLREAMPEEVYEYFVTRDSRGRRFVQWGEMAKYARGKGIDTYTDDELRDNLRTDLKKRREYASGVFESASTSGAIGEFAGRTVAYGMDPVLAPLMMAGPAAASRSIYSAASAAKVFGYGAGLNMAAEVAIQPMVMEWKDELGVEYGIDQVVYNLIAAGVLGGTVEVAAAALGKWIRSSGDQYDSVALRQLHREMTLAESGQNAEEFIRTLDYWNGTLENPKPRGDSMEEIAQKFTDSLESPVIHDNRATPRAADMPPLKGEPKAEEPKAEEPKAEEPKAEEPKAEEPKAEEPKAERVPATEEPKAERVPATEEPKAEEPKAEEPKAEEPKAEEPKAERVPATEEDAFDSLVEKGVFEPTPEQIERERVRMNRTERAVTAEAKRYEIDESVVKLADEFPDAELEPGLSVRESIDEIEVQLDAIQAIEDCLGV